MDNTLRKQLIKREQKNMHIKAKRRREVLKQKLTIIGTIVLCILIIYAINNKEKADIYTTTGYVISENGTTIETIDGNIWVYNTGLANGTKVFVTIDGNNTETVKDDIVVDVK